MSDNKNDENKKQSLEGSLESNMSIDDENLSEGESKVTETDSDTELDNDVITGYAIINNNSNPIDETGGELLNEYDLRKKIKYAKNPMEKIHYQKILGSRCSPTRHKKHKRRK